MRQPNHLLILISLLTLVACDPNETDEDSESLIGFWQQVDKRTTIASGWTVLGSGSYYNITFYDDGTHTIKQGNFANNMLCSGTWESNGNALIMKHDCGRGESQENVHFSIEDTTLTWVYDFSEVGKKFVRSEDPD